MTHAITFQPHKPDFIDAPKPPAVTVPDVAALLALPFVARFRTEMDGVHFTQFVKSAAGERTLLMALYGDNARWLVVGWLDRDVDLPQWQQPRPVAEIPQSSKPAATESPNQ